MSFWQTGIGQSPGHNSKPNSFMSTSHPAVCFFLALILFGGKTGTAGEASPLSSEAEWKRLVTEAKKEGKIVVYGPPGAEPRVALTDGFQKAFPEITVEFTGGSGAVMGPRILAERRAGYSLVDVIVGSPVMLMNTLLPQAALDPLEKVVILAEALDRKAWRGGKLEFSDKEGRWCLMMTGYVHLELSVNGSVVRPEEIRSFKDLLDPKWKGKIVLTDPRVVGPGQLGFTFLYHNRELGPDYVSALAKQEITLLQDHRLLATHVATGKYPVGLFPQPTQIHAVMKAGASVRAIGRLAEGSAMATGFGSLALAGKAPHPNAARVYINWLLTKEGQTLLAKGLAYASRRLDVPTDHLPAFMVPERGITYFETDHEETLKLRVPVLALAKKVFGE